MFYHIQMTAYYIVIKYYSVYSPLKSNSYEYIFRNLYMNIYIHIIYDLKRNDNYSYSPIYKNMNDG